MTLMNDRFVNKWENVPLIDVVDIFDSLRKPVNSKERQTRIFGKSQAELYPYYGATGQVGFIDEYILDGEYVLLGEDGAPFLDSFSNKAYIISGKSWVNNHAHILRSKINNKFLCYYLNYFDYHGYVSGTTRLKLTQADMRKIPVPVPPLSEQEYIVSRIEELYSELDKAVETLQTIEQQLVVYRQAVLKEAFAEERSWPVYRFGELMRVIKNGNGIKPSDNGNERILTIGSVRSLSLDLNNFRLNVQPYNEADLLAENDLLFTRYNGNKDYVGVCARVPKLTMEYAYPDKLIKCRPIIQDNDYSKFLTYYVSQGKARMYLRSKVKTTSGQNGIAGSDIKKMIVRIPQMETIREVVYTVESQLTLCDNIKQIIESALSQSKALRQSILKLAFEGRI